MIVRVLGVGQFRLDDEDMTVVEAADGLVEAALAAGDEAALSAALGDLAATIERVGTPLRVDEFHGSDVVVPGPDTTLGEALALLGDDGAIPG